MMILIWFAAFFLSVSSGLIVNRHYLSRKASPCDGQLFYQIMAGINYILFVFCVLMLGWYALAIGINWEEQIVWWLVITSVLNVSIAGFALRKVSRLQACTAAMK